MTTKLQKIWKLTDESTGMELVKLDREEIECYECSTTVTEEFYLISAEQLKEVLIEGATKLGHISYKESEKWIENYFKQLGVEDE